MERKPVSEITFLESRNKNQGNFRTSRCMGRADVQVKKIVLKITGVFTDRELRNNY